MTKDIVVTHKTPLLPYDFAKIQRIIAFKTDQQVRVISEQNIWRKGK